MDIFQAFILGLVQGLTEFLPISSSGHLVLFQKLFGISGDVVSFDIALHFATLLAVFVVFWKDIIDILKKPFGKLPLLIVVGTIPTVVIGLAFKDTLENLFHSGASLGIEFLLTGAILWYAESVKSQNKGLDKMTYADAAVIGVAQGFAILPAISRSGLTLAGSLFRGLNREFALKFSFLMSIPAILGPAVLDMPDIIKNGGVGADIGTAPLIAGMAASAISGYLAIKFMLNIFKKTSLKLFSYYVFVVGILVLIDQLFIGKFFAKLL